MSGTDVTRETMAGAPPGVAVQLAEWAAGLRFETIPADVLGVARGCIVDTLGVALAGSQTRVAGMARTTAAALYGPGLATALGAARPMAAPGAAFVNATAAHALDFDDNCYAGFVHGSAVLVPAALAMAEQLDLSGEAFLTALVAGAEIEYAVGLAATASLYERGWWTTGVLGPIGAATAGARAMGLDARGIAAAIGIAAAAAGGAKSCFGTDAKPLLCGRAAEAGLTAAILAANGASGPLGAFEDARGFASLLNAGTWDSGPLDRLGRNWSLIDPGLDVKRVPVCLSAHAAIDVTLELMAANALAPGDVDQIDCDVSGIVVANLVHLRPRTPQEAQFSLPFAIACALLHGDIGLEHLDAGTLNAPDLQDLMERVTMSSSDRWARGSNLLRHHPEGAYVTITTQDGRRFERLGRHARGMRQRPLTTEQLHAKFNKCAQQVPGLDDIRLLDRLQHVHQVSSVREIFGERLPEESWPEN